MKPLVLAKIARFLRFRAQVLQAQFAERRLPAETWPLPPPLLRYRVHGALDRESFLMVGRRCAADITKLLALIGKDINAFENILDFGCGSGRVIRFFYDHPASCHFHGIDIDDQAIGWCRQNLPFADWQVNDAMPPLRYDDATFDFIFAISVFTHLDTTMQRAWLQELKRVLRPGGILLLSIHGNIASATLDEESRQSLARTGFLYKIQETEKFKRVGLPNFYQNSFHSPDYVQETFSEFFTVQAFVEGGINTLQDAVILRNERPPQQITECRQEFWAQEF